MYMFLQVLDIFEILIFHILEFLAAKNYQHL